MATMEAVVHIGERLRELRVQRALRQEDLASSPPPSRWIPPSSSAGNERATQT
jgi:hypothetical protein